MRLLRLRLPWTVCVILTMSGTMLAQNAETFSKLETELIARYGETERVRLLRGMRQVASIWRHDDGDEKAFVEFVRKYFAGSQAELDTMFVRFQHLLEQLDGHMLEVTREFRRQSDLDIGPIRPHDELFAAYDPKAHVSEDFFANKIAFVALLNFPLTTLSQKLEEGEKWSRRAWAETRLAQRFSRRIPADVNQAIAKAAGEADQYIAEYNIYAHHLVNGNGERLFPPKLRLLAHWNLRDQIKADYSEGRKGLARQRAIQQVMERIVTQTIPAVVVNNPHVDWNPFTNDVKAAAVRDEDTQPPAGMNITAAPEPDRRYEMLLKTFLAVKKADPYSPGAPTHIARKFNEDREIPEERVKKMLQDIVSSSLVADIAKIIEGRLGRPLEPFDIWYNGFRPRGTRSEAELDKIVSRKYPTAQAFKRDMPNLLQKLGFNSERANVLANNILVEPARGSGHAWGSQLRSGKALLRTRVEKGGMNYKGFNIAIHELGHNVEQTFSLNMIDYWLLNGVPNTAFTEALAFVFQARDMDLLGMARPNQRATAFKALGDFWATCEIAGVALVDMEVWHWMYDHPDATPAQLKEATLAIARNIWNMYYAPVFRQRDVVLLGIYSHMIHSFLYLPDYPLGHLIAHQIEERVNESGNLGREFERMARYGALAPDLWMKQATGLPVGPEAMIISTRRALEAIK